MSESYWREESATVIQEVVCANPCAHGAELMTLLRAAYPFGVKRYWPYKVWRSEVRYQLGIDKRPTNKKRPEPVPPEQGALF